jgi:bacterioferritin
MQGHPAVIDALNAVLTAELTAINQYFIHYKMCENWGYKVLAKKKREESIEEMVHAERMIGRILFLDGVPNMQRMNPVRVGEDPIEQHEVDLALELEAVKRLNDAIALCVREGDNGTRELLANVLREEEEAVDWHETQLHLVKELGKERYLAEQLFGSSGSSSSSSSS